MKLPPYLCGFFRYSVCAVKAAIFHPSSFQYAACLGRISSETGYYIKNLSIP
jgi:hypothetical protein